MNQLSYAEDVNYFQTGKSSPDYWIDLAKRQIEAVGGKVEGEGFGMDGQGRAAFMLAFTLHGEKFKIVWPVLASKTGKDRAARVQAATMLHHHIKAACLSAVVLGARTAFFGHLMLPDGRTAAQLADPELADNVPSMLLLGSGH